MTVRFARVLAFDPGPTWTGWAVAELGPAPSQRVHLLEWGKVESTPARCAAIIDGFRGTVDGGLAIETPSGYLADKARVAQLMATAAVAGMLRGLAAGLPTLELPAQKWRRALCAGCRGTPGDAHVKRALGLYVAAFPKTSNTHTRDALGLAVAALWHPHLFR